MNDSRLKCGVSNEPRTRDIALEERSVSNYTILTFIVNTHNMNCFLKISSDFENLLCFSAAFSINRYWLRRWSHQMDSNHRPIIYETIALSLSYGGICAVGVVRTHDSILKRDVLYQLSYDSIKTWRWLFTVNIHNMRWFSKISSAESKNHYVFLNPCLYLSNTLLDPV